ncbi:MAG: RNA-binding protein [Candidatus Omnitrophica bacterium]|nr:RNA-binding protein [Candidatus Omnitrophota bacterium]
MENPKKIYIGNLDDSITEGNLKSLLEEKGIIVEEVKIVLDKYTGRSKGFGFAEFVTEEAADQAIKILNGYEVNGKTMQASKAKETKRRRDDPGSDEYSDPRR